MGSVVYTLQGIDPEGANVLYTISGDHFSVNRNTGVITLRAPLDREVEDLLDVVVTIQDENFPDQIGKSCLDKSIIKFFSNISLFSQCHSGDKLELLMSMIMLLLLSRAFTNLMSMKL